MANDQPHCTNSGSGRDWLSKSSVSWSTGREFVMEDCWQWLSFCGRLVSYSNSIYKWVVWKKLTSKDIKRNTKMSNFPDLLWDLPSRSPFQPPHLANRPVCSRDTWLEVQAICETYGTSVTHFQEKTGSYLLGRFHAKFRTVDLTVTSRSILKMYHIKNLNIPWLFKRKVSLFVGEHPSPDVGSWRPWSQHSDAAREQPWRPDLTYGFFPVSLGSVCIYLVYFGLAFLLKLEAEGKGTKASEGKCGHVKRGVVGRVQSCLGTPSTLCLSSTFKRWQYSKAGNSIREIQDIVPKLNIQEVTVQQGRE